MFRVPKCTNKAENRLESMTSSDIPVLSVEKSDHPHCHSCCHSCWRTLRTQESPWVFHSAGQRGHSRAHSPKLVTGRKRAWKRGLGTWQSLFQVRSETTQRTSTAVMAAQPGPGITAGPQTCSVNLKFPSLPGLIQTPGFLSLLDSSTDLAWKKEWI